MLLQHCPLPAPTPSQALCATGVLVLCSVEAVAFAVGLVGEEHAAASATRVAAVAARMDVRVMRARRRRDAMRRPRKEWMPAGSF